MYPEIVAVDSRSKGLKWWFSQFYVLKGDFEYGIQGMTQNVTIITSYFEFALQNPMGIWV